MQRISILMCLSIVILWSYTKYEEGPTISFRSAEKRVAGNWRIASYTVDGVDSMAVVRALDLQGKFAFFTYEKDNAQLSVYTDDNVIVSPGVWKFFDKKKTIYIFLDDDSLFEGIQQVPLRDVWTIVRLKHEEMWLQLDKDGKKYELRFEPYQLK